MGSWPHAPARIAVSGGAVIVTAATYHKEHLFTGEDRLSHLQATIFEHCEALCWQLQAWAVFPNHYHFVALASEDADLKRLLKRIHGSSGNFVSKADATKGQMVWYRDWATPLTFEKSYLVRLAYVHRNAVHHGIVRRAEAYPFCSAKQASRTRH